MSEGKTTQSAKRTRSAAAETGTPVSAFQGFGPGTFSFFEGLAAAQNREWFEANRPVYEQDVLQPMAALIATLSNAFAMREVPLTGDPKRSVFRIHRDVRFSKDKRPYKTHIGATLTRSGARMAPGVLYIHVAPEGCFSACGFFRPEPEHLDALRQRLVAKPELFRDVLRKMAERGLVLGEDEQALKRPPRGYESIGDADIAEWIRQKSLIVRRPLERESAFGKEIALAIADFAEAAMPLLDFGWRAIGHDRG